MVIQLEKKKGLQRKHIPYVAGGVLFVILLGWIIFGDHASTLKVDARGISIGNVTREQFNDFFRMDGQVQPITVVQLSPGGGRYRTGESRGRGCPSEERRYHCSSEQLKSGFADIER